MQTSFLAGLAAGTTSVFVLAFGASIGFTPAHSPEGAADAPATEAASLQAIPLPERAPPLLDLSEHSPQAPISEALPEEIIPPVAEDGAEAFAVPQPRDAPPSALPDLAQPDTPAPGPDSAPPLPEGQIASQPASTLPAPPSLPNAPDALAALDAPAPFAALAPTQEANTTSARPEPKAMPGTPVPGLVPMGVPEAAAPDIDRETIPPAPHQSGAALTALERNAQYDGTAPNAAKMALVLYDPGLPMALRHAVAALDFPLTIALNPLDSSAPEAAEMYFHAGKEILILAAGLPAGATPSDIEVTLGSYLDGFPLAIGLVDLPTEGFARNASLLRDVLAILRRDGHGLITFAGGLTQAPRAAEAAEVRHAEIFRVIDPGLESQFTIRRFLDRAVFQASQLGYVIVYGDAANDATMKALELWRNEGRADQVALVPVSAILLGQE